MSELKLFVFPQQPLLRLHVSYRHSRRSSLTDGSSLARVALQDGIRSVSISVNNQEKSDDVLETHRASLDPPRTHNAQTPTSSLFGKLKLVHGSYPGADAGMNLINRLLF